MLKSYDLHVFLLLLLLRHGGRRLLPSRGDALACASCMEGVFVGIEELSARPSATSASKLKLIAENDALSSACHHSIAARDCNLFSMMPVSGMPKKCGFFATRFRAPAHGSV